MRVWSICADFEARLKSCLLFMEAFAWIAAQLAETDAIGSFSFLQFHFQ